MKRFSSSDSFEGLEREDVFPIPIRPLGKGKHEERFQSLLPGRMEERFSSSDSFEGLEREDVFPIPIRPLGKGKHEERFQSLLPGRMEEVEEEEQLCLDGQSSLGEKKRRLSLNQVRALEKNFEAANRLDPERKVRLAQEVGLQPRQVAVWFQNRRAWWKTKQLERNYSDLKARHDALSLDHDALCRDKEALEANIRELKAELARSAMVAPDWNGKASEEKKRAAFIHKDGASDSDSSVLFNDEGSDQHNLMGFRSHCSSFLFENKAQDEGLILYREEPCSSLFSEEQVPSFSWYCSEGWD
ncbi:hypothetical protein C4D60_Mb05t16960 [Musa balbisiana]|uniref:Homeobox-leucine zipper protein n=1 Tax=Musa balbisiana TaxID=52838 RepID=A0A4S8JWQ8_MUSBA|nr:hypothetical protein C4D60_Mb05t16960 [Musa balbisiana]